MKKLIVILLVCFVGASAFSQMNDQQKALGFYQEKQYDSAAVYIDKALESTDFENDPYTWHVKGFIYKELTKQAGSSNNKSKELSCRKEAINALFKSKELDLNKEFENNNIKSIRYLTDQYWNDAVIILKESPEEYAKAVTSFNMYKENSIKIGNEEVVNDRELLFTNAIASLFSSIYEQDKEKNKEFFNKAIEAYSRTIELDSNNYQANYNIGILYYNEGVDIILGLDPTTPLLELIEKEEETAKLFQKSLPYMLKAYDLNKTKTETIEGLIGIFYQLNEKEKSKFYSDLLEKIKEQEEPEKEDNE